jgi:phosphate-selective porin OprO and OprP
MEDRMHTRTIAMILAATASFAASAPALAQQPAANAEHPLDATYVPGQGVSLASPADDFELRIWTRAQLRVTASDDGSDKGIQESMEVRRASLFLAGHAFSPHMKYFSQFIFTPREINAASLGAEVQQHGPLFDMFITLDHNPNLSVRMGLFKPFYSRQFIAAWGDLAFVDRPGSDGELRMERDLGFDLHSLDLLQLGMLRYHLGLFSGHGRDNVSNTTPAFTGVARLEFLPMGMFDDYVDADVNRTPAPKLAIGISGAYQHHAALDRGVFGKLPADGGTTNISEATADAIFKWNGLSAQGALFVRKGDRVAPDTALPPGTALTAPRDALGGFGQLGYLLPGAPVELGVRYDRISKLNDASSVDELQDAGGQVSYYIFRNSIKLQGDYLHLWGQSANKPDSDQVRVQLQMTL